MSVEKQEGAMPKWLWWLSALD